MLLQIDTSTTAGWVPPPFTYFPILIQNSHQSGNMLDVHMNFIGVRNIRDQGKHEAHGKVFEKAVK